MEDGAAEGAETLPYFSMYRAMIAFSVGVPVYDAFCSAPVSCGKCLREVLDGPRDCQRARVLLDHVHAHGLERRVLTARRRSSWLAA